MGSTQLLQFPISATAPSPQPPLLRLLLFPLYRNSAAAATSSSSKFSNGTRWRSAGYRDHGGGRPNWDSKTVRVEEGFKFSLDDDDKEDDDGFGSRSGAKKRVWWSENSMGFDDDDEEEEEGFGVLEDSIDMSWIFKVHNFFSF